MSDPSRAESIFLAALERPPADRPAWLDEACGADSDLRHRVERLLAAQAKNAGFLEVPAGVGEVPTAALPPAADRAGTIVAGRYKLLERIGAGGMGEVWMADQLAPIKRRVAVKLIKAGMDSRSVLARFEAERQALAVMDHPHIARVLDAGSTDEGRPFFVMELVKGVPITTFCDARRLGPRERIALFVPVCQAIQHAHQKGIIHRDIKPGNVLVELHDDRPVPKVIDFGLAKAVGQPLTEQTLFTGFGALVGTPTYMAPEQATFNAVDVDTRADVYALGILLYELLAGSPPLESERVKKAALDEVLRLIREEDPPRPSQRLSTSETKASIAAVRGSEPARLSALIRGELDWIVMKALEKNRSRRYDSASALSKDVENYLHGEAVLAHPPSAVYRLTKFARRHMARVLAAAAFLALLVAATAVSLGLAVKAKRAELVAEEERAEAVRSGKEAAEYLGRSVASMERANELRIEAETAAASARVDIDLKEAEANPPLGLLRLCDTRDAIGEKRAEFAEIQTISPKEELLRPLDDLDSFLAAAILTLGQARPAVSLLPPITHDGTPAASWHLSADGGTLLTRGFDCTARLWRVGTAEPLAILRQGDEEVFNCGFSPDGKTAYTIGFEQGCTIRFWDVPSGKHRFSLPLQSDVGPDPSLPGVYRFDWPLGRTPILVGAGRAITRHARRVVDAEGDAVIVAEGPVELWDTSDGRRIARLDAPGRDVGSFTFIDQGHWIGCVEEPTGIVILSAEDGSPVATRQLPGGEPAPDAESFGSCFVSSPDGRWIASKMNPRATPIHLHDTSDWSKPPVTVTPPTQGWETVQFLGNDRLLFVASDYSNGQWMGPPYQGIAMVRIDDAMPIRIADWLRDDPSPRVVGDLALDRHGGVYDVATDRRIMPPRGRSFPDEITRFAPDGRFIELEGALIDTRTEKRIPGTDRTGAVVLFPVPDLGLVCDTFGLVGSALFVIGDDRLASIPRDLLRLWASVCVRGELDAEGRFVPWTEAEWEARRAELAAAPAPIPGFPFPGHVAGDRLFWLRAEFHAAADKAPVARKLLERAEALGERVEADAWRRWLADRPENAPQAP